MPEMNPNFDQAWFESDEGHLVSGVYRAIDDMDAITSGLNAVASLCGAAEDLHTVSGSDMALLLDVLVGALRATNDKCRAQVSDVRDRLYQYQRAQRASP